MKFLRIYEKFGEELYKEITWDEYNDYISHHKSDNFNELEIRRFDDEWYLVSVVSE